MTFKLEVSFLLYLGTDFFLSQKTFFDPNAAKFTYFEFWSAGGCFLRHNRDFLDDCSNILNGVLKIDQFLTRGYTKVN